MLENHLPGSQESQGGCQRYVPLVTLPRGGRQKGSQDQTVKKGATGGLSGAGARASGRLATVQRELASQEAGCKR